MHIVQSPKADVMDREPQTPWKILVVDDERAVRETLAGYLNLLDGYEVYQAANAYEGLALFQELDGIDGILADVNMPGMDGIEFVHRIKDRDRTVVAVIITGYPSLDLIVEAMRAGASDFLIKPFRLEQFKVAMKRLVHERKILVENQYLTNEVKAKKALEEVNRQLERKVREQAILFTISNALSRVRSTQELYQRVVHLSCTLTEAKGAYFWLVNHEKQKLILIAAVGAYVNRLF